MKRDLDRLMEARGLNAIVVSGATHGNPPMYYLTNGAGIGKASILVMPRGKTPTLIASTLEREEALAAGYPIRLTTEFKFQELLKEAGGDSLAATVAYYRRILSELGVTGRVGFYGLDSRGSAYVFLKALAEAATEIEPVGEFDRDLIAEARATKGREEADRIRGAGRRTIAVVAATVDFLRHHEVGSDEILRRADGEILTVGDVHAFIRLQIAAQGLEDPEGFIFATGHDAGVPHNKGTLTAPMRLGESIVFDIYPREAGSGYFFDFTRTFALGYASEALQKLYRDVYDCQQMLFPLYKAGEEARHYQRLTCKFFAERGYPTVAEDPYILSGYIHSVSHGLGLDVHEHPFSGDVPGNTARLEAGHCFSVEPGLYYPEQGMGVRLEDLIWLNEEGKPEILSDYPYELVIPMA